MKINISSIDWQNPSNNRIIEKDHIHTWCVHFSAIDDPTKFWSLLSRDEKQRADRLRSRKQREIFIITRGSLRKILGFYLSEDPNEIEFIYGPYGKPSITSGCYFNVSHSNDVALITITKNNEIGVDIEHMRDLHNYDEIVQRFFTLNEYQQFKQLPESAKKQAFYCAWTKKEAFIKANGQGLYQGLKAFSVSFDLGDETNFFTGITGILSSSYMYAIAQSVPVERIEFFSAQTFLNNL